MDYIF